MMIFLTVVQFCPYSSDQKRNLNALSYSLLVLSLQRSSRVDWLTRLTSHAQYSIWSRLCYGHGIQQWETSACFRLPRADLVQWAFSEDTSHTLQSVRISSAISQLAKRGIINICHMVLLIFTVLCNVPEKYSVQDSHGVLKPHCCVDMWVEWEIEMRERFFTYTAQCDTNKHLKAHGTQRTSSELISIKATGWWAEKISMRSWQSMTSLQNQMK